MTNKNIFRLWICFLFAFSAPSYAQELDPLPLPNDPTEGEFDGRVGINTRQPKATLHIAETLTEFEQPMYNIPNGSLRPQGVMFPSFTTEQLEKFGNVSYGTMVYNTDKDCIQIYKRSNSWICLCTCPVEGVPPPTDGIPQPEPQPQPQPSPDFQVDNTQTTIHLDGEETTGIWLVNIPYHKTSTEPIRIYDAIEEENYPSDGLKLTVTIYGRTIDTDGSGNISVYIEWKLENPNHIPNDKVISLNIGGQNVTLTVSFSN